MHSYCKKNSKSIKRKNIVKINGKELVKYSFDEIKSLKKHIKKTIVSTDDPTIKKISKNYDFEIIHRSSKLSGDLVNSVDVVIDVLKKCKLKFNYLPKFFF